MRSNATKAYYFHAGGHPLGGVIEQPVQKSVPSQASGSLSAVGGHVTSRTDAFNFEEIVSCRSAYTRVSGRQAEENGSWWTLVTSVIEGLNILEVVTADRIVAQVSVEHPADGGSARYSFTGSRFERLQIAGCDASLTLNSSLLTHVRAANASRDPITWPIFQETGSRQAAKLIKSVGGDAEYKWLSERYDWMVSKKKPGANGSVMCSVVDGVDPAIPGKSFAHVVVIPHFGTIIFGEIVAFPASVQLSMIRAELGCATHGALNMASAVVNGTGMPP
jgi:hypothetical protein